MLLFIILFCLILGWTVYGFMALGLDVKSWNAIVKKVRDLVADHPIVIVGIVGTVIAAIGHHSLHDGFDFWKFTEEFYNNYFAEIMGIALTVYLIDRLNRQRDEQKEIRSERERLMIQVRSSDPSEVAQAIRMLSNRGWISQTYLYGVNLSSTDLRDADLIGANLMRANLTGTNLSSANLNGVILTGAALSGADLSNARLKRASLRDADLSFANLHGAMLHDAYLCYTDFRNADLYRADLRNADLSGAKLVDAQLISTNLSGANLSDANLWNAKLQRANFQNAEYNRNTIWPADFDPQAAGVIEARLLDGLE